MPNLPAVNHLTHIDEEERSAGMLLGNLRCFCGSETFRAAHDGRAIRALLGDRWDNWVRDAQR